MFMVVYRDALIFRVVVKHLHHPQHFVSHLCLLVCSLWLDEHWERSLPDAVLRTHLGATGAATCPEADAAVGSSVATATRSVLGGPTASVGGAGGVIGDDTRSRDGDFPAGSQPSLSETARNPGSSAVSLVYLNIGGAAFAGTAFAVGYPFGMILLSCQNQHLNIKHKTDNHTHIHRSKHWG